MGHPFTFPPSADFLAHWAGHGLHTNDSISQSFLTQRTGRKKAAKKKVGFFVSRRKKRQREGISVSFPFRGNAVILKHALASKSEQRSPTFFRILLGQQGRGSRNKGGKTARKRSSPAGNFIIIIIILDDHVNGALFVCASVFPSCPRLSPHITGVTDKGALRQRECHHGGTKPYFLRVGQPLP